LKGCYLWEKILSRGKDLGQVLRKCVIYLKNGGMILRKIAIFICLCLLILSLFGSVQAAAKVGNGNFVKGTSIRPYTSQSSIPVNKETLTEFLDEFITEQMEKHNIAGALVAAVNNKEIIMSKGYGYANIEEKSPMEPTSSVFRAASVSKLFTATVLLQLAEKGLVDLNTDINEYLGEGKVPDTYSQPITLSHKTHNLALQVLDDG